MRIRFVARRGVAPKLTASVPAFIEEPCDGHQDFFDSFAIHARGAMQTDSLSRGGKHRQRLGPRGGSARPAPGGVNTHAAALSLAVHRFTDRGRGRRIVDIGSSIASPS